VHLPPQRRNRPLAFPGCAVPSGFRPMRPESTGKRRMRLQNTIHCGVSLPNVCRLLSAGCSTDCATIMSLTGRRGATHGELAQREKDTMNTRYPVVCLVLSFFLAVAASALGQENLEQDELSIRGNRALPKTLYIAPWKRLGTPLEGDALNSRLEDRMDPVEQDLFRKELELHQDGYILD